MSKKPKAKTLLSPRKPRNWRSSSSNGISTDVTAAKTSRSSPTPDFAPVAGLLVKLDKRYHEQRMIELWMLRDKFGQLASPDPDRPKPRPSSSTPSGASKGES